MKIFQIIILTCILFQRGCDCNENNQREHQSGSSDARYTSRPHIITIIADDLGWNDVSFHGADQIPTPNIDALAANGIVLNRYYVLPICTPSRTAYLTGKYPLRTGMQGFPLDVGERWGIPLGITLLPEYLRNLGYTTRIVGKWHVGYYSVHHTPTHRGFDSFVGYYSGLIKYFAHTIRQNSTNENGYDVHHDTPKTSRAERNTEYFTDFVSTEVEEIVRTHDVSKPLYLHVGHLAPHSGEPDELLEVWNMTEVNSTFGYIKDINRRKYAGMVSRLDQSVGRIVKALQKAGMLENSIVILTNDNGAQTEGFLMNYGSNYPLRGLKTSLFDGGVRGTACIYSPLLTNRSRVSNELMHITDWMPTLYSAAGGDISDLGEIDGVNQWPVLRGQRKSPRHSLILNIDEKLGTAGAVFKNFKLLKGNQTLYTDFYGDTGRDVSYPAYNATSVLTSDAGRAIAEISNRTATLEQIIQVRERTNISCPAFNKYANCTNVCLFNLDIDPCETVDVSAENAKITELMENYIARYNAFLIPQLRTGYDPASSPSHSGGVWMPWVKLDCTTDNLPANEFIIRSNRIKYCSLFSN